MRTLGAAAFPLALVASLAALTFWLERAANPEDPERKAQMRHDPDSIIQEIVARHFDASGTLRQQLQAETVTHYPDDDSTWITKPQLNYYADQQTIRLFADTAKVTHDYKQVFLRGDVRLIKPPVEGLPATIMQTETLTIYPDDDMAKGDSRTTISRGENVVSGDSIQYYGKTSITVLSGRVKGIFYRMNKS